METFSVPSTPTKFNNFQNTAVRLIVANGVAWGVLPLATTNLLAAQAAYATAYGLCSNKTTRSTANIVTRDSLQSPFSAALVSVYEKYLLNNPLIAAADQLSLGIHSPSTVRTPVAAPGEAPSVKITNGETLQMIVYMRNAANGKVAKPKGVGFMEVWYKVGDPAPVVITDCINKVNIHRKGDAILFALTDKAKNVYFYCRWVNTKGVEGPWTTLITGVVS